MICTCAGVWRIVRSRGLCNPTSYPQLNRLTPLRLRLLWQYLLLPARPPLSEASSQIHAVAAAVGSDKWVCTADWTGLDCPIINGDASNTEKPNATRLSSVMLLTLWSLKRSPAAIIISIIIIVINVMYKNKYAHNCLPCCTNGNRETELRHYICVCVCLCIYILN